MFNRVIVSVNESQDFIDFVPVVSAAWKKFFPNVKLSIAFVSDRDENDSLVKRMNNYGDVHIFKTINGIPTSNHAKVARHILASKFTNDICMIEDIDTIPLQYDFFVDRTSKHQTDKLLAVGQDVYANTPHSRNFPISTMTATGKVFKEIINPKNLLDEDIPLLFVNNYTFNIKEDISIPYPDFSDEYLMASLIDKWGGEVIHVNRDVNTKENWIDRSWWNIDKVELYSEKYVVCNFLRNLRENFNLISPVLDFVYGKSVSLEEVVL